MVGDGDQEKEMKTKERNEDKRKETTVGAMVGDGDQQK
tara:strand:- start:101 stop:214 length:114 start_codon:yes stop_codon:yes gene_type:complete